MSKNANEWRISKKNDFWGSQVIELEFTPGNCFLNVPYEIVKFLKTFNILKNA